MRNHGLLLQVIKCRLIFALFCLPGAAFAQYLPSLSITNLHGQFSIALPAFATNFILQSANRLDSSNNWTDESPYGIGGGGYAIYLVETNSSKFFRLRESSDLLPGQIVPIFQFAIFYNLDLELNPGTVEIVSGHVHSNGNLWATGTSSSSPLIFSNLVYAVGLVTNIPSGLDPLNAGRSGNVIYSITSNNPVSFAAPLYLVPHSPTNSTPLDGRALLGLPPAALAPPNFGAAYIENNVDLVITNAPNGTNGTRGTNIVVLYQNPNNSPNFLTPVLPDVLLVSNVVGSITNVIYDYSFVTNVSFFDYRESRVVQAVQLDIGKFNAWLADTSRRGGFQYNQLNISGGAAKGHAIDSIYVYNAVPLSGTNLPAVRVSNGQQLPINGFVIATPQPMYVFGNYNTTTNGINFSTGFGDTKNTVPAALLGDAITILSASWSDSFGSGTSLSSRNIVSDLTVNVAIYQGIVPSDGAHYSGGFENSLRLLENWSGHTLTWNGSAIVMFSSQYATNPWQITGVYYQAPTRKWGFDTNFLNLNRLPPLTPSVWNAGGSASLLPLH
jgi:hypothetical protein